ncbi:hypothetical protein FGIG_01557 [Fasciola gigantica]|uniref:Uncharacterized protein n=1 Tax=Fasciola gigantica TaxID=46835 RepID=A0A504YMQ9_FASGI|nr:hypothetical protein FGIG_01557 [Fasciola gigantica]
MIWCHLIGKYYFQIRIVAYARMWSSYKTSKWATTSIVKEVQFSLKKNDVQVTESLKSVSFNFSSTPSVFTIKTIYAQNQPFPPVFTSTFNNGQNNLMRVPLGTVVNTGATITAGTTLVDSDVVYFKVGLQLADSENAIQGMSVSVKATLIFDTVNYTAIGQMSIKREGAEEAKITVQSTVHEVVNRSGLIYPG